MLENPQFTRTMEWFGMRLLIRSQCGACGAGKLVSAADGSLGKWEDGHRCGDRIEDERREGEGESERSGGGSGQPGRRGRAGAHEDE